MCWPGEKGKDGMIIADVDFDALVDKLIEYCIKQEAK